VTITGASPFRFTIQTGVLPAGALVTWASVDHASTWTTVAGTITGLTLSVGATTGTQDTYYTASQNLFAATGNTEGSGFPKRPNGTGADLVKGVLVGTFSSGNFTGQDLTGTANIHVCWVQP
jgi:S-adenosylhomocysteine hydrolase